MDIYGERNYRKIIKARVKQLAATRKGFTLRKLAGMIPVQNTYLSRALNDPKTHLNEDHLFKACKILQLFPQEIDYVFLLRAQAIAAHADRRTFLEAKLNRLRQASQRSASYQEYDTRQLSQEMAYLFDPACTVVHLALFVPEYRASPRKLCPVLGITYPRLREILTRLRDLNFIELDPEKMEVLRVTESQIHYGTDHPLMRTHQSLMRDRCSVHLNQLPEEAKSSFMGTFSADEATFEKVRARFKAFLKEAEQLIGPAPSEAVYQLNFDLFRWL